MYYDIPATTKIASPIVVIIDPMLMSWDGTPILKL